MLLGACRRNCPKVPLGACRRTWPIGLAGGRRLVSSCKVPGVWSIGLAGGKRFISSCKVPGICFFPKVLLGACRRSCPKVLHRELEVDSFAMMRALILGWNWVGMLSMWRPWGKPDLCRNWYNNEKIVFKWIWIEILRFQFWAEEVKTCIFRRPLFSAMLTLIFV